jgi:hypothetical protein
MAGCAATNDSSLASKDRTEPMSLIIDFQTGFIGNWIELKVDGERMFAGALATDNRIGLAGRLRLTLPSSTNLSVTVTVDRFKHYPFQVDLERGFQWGLSRNLDDGSIHLTQTHEPFVYD